jgi:hypothetical protein
MFASIKVFKTVLLLLLYAGRGEKFYEEDSSEGNCVRESLKFMASHALTFGASAPLLGHMLFTQNFLRHNNNN